MTETRGKTGTGTETTGTGMWMVPGTAWSPSPSSRGLTFAGGWRARNTRGRRSGTGAGVARAPRHAPRPSRRATRPRRTGLGSRVRRRPRAVACPSRRRRRRRASVDFSNSPSPPARRNAREDSRRAATRSSPNARTISPRTASPRASRSIASRRFASYRRPASCRDAQASCQDA